MEITFTDNTKISDNTPWVYSIEIVAPGILVTKQGADRPAHFYPWHRINKVTGRIGEFEHELEQFRHLGIGGD